MIRKKKKMVKLLIYAMLIAGISCQQESEVATTKHKLLEEDENRGDFFQEHRDEFLINKIFEEELTISYYIDPALNLKPYQIDALEQAMEDSIKTWLSALGGAGAVKNGRKIVSKFKFVNDTKSYMRSKKVFRIGTKSGDFSFGVFFYKQEGTSFASAIESCPTSYAKCGGGEVHMMQENELNLYSNSNSSTGGKPICFDIADTGFNIHTLTHEFGHLIGLADTYKGSSTGETIMNEHTGMPQPHSVMSCGFEQVDENGNPTLAPDDTCGILDTYHKHYPDDPNIVLPDFCFKDTNGNIRLKQ